MTDLTLKLLAVEIQISVERLIEKFANVGIHKSAGDKISQQEKDMILSYLNREYPPFNLSKRTLHRKMRSTLNIVGTGGKSKEVQIEVRKKCTYLAIDSESKKNRIDDLKKQNEVKNKVFHENEINKSINSNHEQCKQTESKINTKQKNINTSKSEIVKNKTLIDLNNETKLNNFKKNNNIPFNKGGKECRQVEKGQKTVKETRRSAKEKSLEWKISKKQTYENYQSNTLLMNDEEETNGEIKVARNRTRNIKVSRQAKKSKKNLESKMDREEQRVALRIGKISKNRKAISLQHGFNKPVHVINRDVIIGETITVSELANKMAVKSSLVITAMMKMGVLATINQVIDQETAQLVAEEMRHKVILRRENELETAVMDDRDTDTVQKSRAPVVTIMGHVDHGKTSLLDYIRSTKVATNEVGGITQHIGAYHVQTETGMITFLDTPGHAAFTAMRARGAQATDIVVLVVAADDGIMPQTIEAIQHARAASVPIIVAINKIDKLEADPNRVKKELMQHGIIAEEWGGENIFVNVSAKTGMGIDNLLNAILLQAEVLELRAIHNGMASGIVIESFLDKGRGPIATILVREGTLRKGNIVLCGFEYGRIRAMRDEYGYEVMEAGPSIPVEILGLSGVPSAGDTVTVVRNEKKAREVALYRQGKFREVKLSNQKQLKLDNVFANMHEGKVSELSIVLKADVQGSVEAITDSILKLSSNDVKVKIIGSGVGGITETDATLAAASHAIILGFNVRADSTARRIIESENIDLRYYSIIYNLIDEIKAAMNGMLVPEYKQKIIGLAEVRNVFKSPNFGAIAGCMVTEGNIKRHNPIHILRNNVVIYQGALESLRRFKDDVHEVRSGMECGIGVKNYNDIRIGDTIEVFEIIEVKRTIS